jgi:hypothetical protein
MIGLSLSIYLIFLQCLRLLFDNHPIYEDATQLNDIYDVGNKMVALIQMCNEFVLRNVVILEVRSSC